MQTNHNSPAQKFSHKKMTLRHFFMAGSRPRLTFYFWLIMIFVANSFFFLWASGAAPWLWQPAIGNDQRNDTSSLPAEKNLPWVETNPIKLEREIKLPREYSGVLRSARSSELGFKRTGQLIKVHAEQGEVIEAGQLLAELDTDLLMASKQELRAKLRGAEALLAELMAGPRQQTIEFAKTQVADLEAQLTLAQGDYDRFQQLYQSRAISDQEFDSVRVRLASINQRLSGAREQLNELQEGTRTEQIEAQRAAVAGMEATLQRIEVEISESRLLAPYNAVVSKRHYDVGSIVGAGMAIFRTVERDQIEAWIGLPVEATTELVVGKSYPMTIDRAQHYGELIAISPELDQATRTLVVRFSITDPVAHRLVPGQLVRLQLWQNINQSGFWIPFQALSRGQRGLWNVLVVSQTDDQTSVGRLVNRDVEIIQLDTDRVLVRGILSDGERIVTDGLHRLTAGQQVRFRSSGKSSSNDN